MVYNSVVLIDIRNNASDKLGRKYRVVIKVVELEEHPQYPEGVKALFKLFRLDKNGEEQLILLLDNHEPFGFHEHHRLPENKKVRRSLNTKKWEEVRAIFQQRIKEKFNEH